MPQLKAGSRLKSAVCDAEVMIVKPGNGDAALTCGGAPMSATATNLSRCTRVRCLTMERHA